MSQEAPEVRKHARALLVLGAPRSGTTLIGSYLASCPGCLDLGEYGGFHLAHSVAPSVLGRFPGPLRDVYLADLRNHARDFAEDAADEGGALDWYVDGTPWNLASARTIAEDLPDAIFVLMLRHYAGTIQSLRRSFAAGFAWAGRTVEDSARVWATMYSHVAEVPPERTAVAGFDRLAAAPSETLAELDQGLGGLGFDSSGADRRSLLISHANLSGPRPTIAAEDGVAIVLRSIPSFDPADWNAEVEERVRPLVQEVHQDLLRRYPGKYFVPEGFTWE